MKKTIDDVYDAIEGLLVDGRIEEAQATLRSLTGSDAPLAVLLSALIVSRPWRADLGDARVGLVEAARRVAQRDGGEAKVRQIARFLS